MIGGPIRRNRTFFFVDYQGQRQTIGRTVISTVPTLLQRQGVFTEAIGGRVPAIYDPATTAPGATGGSTRSQFPGNTIPLERMDPVARDAAGSAIRCRPAPGPPTTTGASTTRRSIRISSACGSIIGFPTNRDQVFGRLTRFREEFIPVTPLPDGSGVTTGTLGPQDTTSWSFASSYQRTFSTNVLNELRIGDTRRTVGRTAAQLSGTASASLGLPGIPSNARISEHAADVSHRRLSAARIAAEHGVRLRHERDPDRRFAHVAEGTAHAQDGRRPALGAAQRRPAAVADRVVHVQQPLHRSAAGRPPTRARRSPAFCSARSSSSRSTCSRSRSGTARTSRSTSSRTTGDCRIASPSMRGVRYTLNFPSTEENNQVAVFNLETQQLEYLGRDGQPRAARQLHKLNFGPRLGIVGRVTDKTVVRTGYGMVWIEMAGITTPFTTPVFPFLQTVSQRTLDNIVPGVHARRRDLSVEPIPLTPDAGLGQGVFAVDRDLGSGYVQQWNASLQRELTSNISRGGGLHRLEDHPRRHPRHEPESADRRTARAGRVAAAARAESVLRHHPAVVVARRSDDPAWRSCSSRIRSTRRSASIGTTSARPSITASTPSSNSGSRAACRISSATRARS